MSEATQPSPIPQQPEVVQVDSIHEFVTYTTRWHEAQIARLHHLLTVPEGSEFTIGDGPEAETVTMTQDTLRGFKLGIELALMQVGQLPFLAETEDVEANAA